MTSSRARSVRRLLAGTATVAMALTGITSTATADRSATPARSTSTPTSSTAPCCTGIDLGVNIRAGAHYTQFLVYDFDGDGRSEMMLKTAPGTKIDPVRPGRHGRLRALHHACRGEDVRAGYSHTDDYRLSAADYYEHLVEMFLGWHEHPEVVAGRLAGDAGGGVRHRADGTRTRCPRRTPRRWPTTSSTCTPRAAAPATSCATSRASSSTVRST